MRTNDDHGVPATPEGQLRTATGEPELAAGDFSTWLAQMRKALSDRGSEGGADVPCGGCTACCTSSQFIHIGPEETDTLSHIPAGLLFPAPRLPAGHVLLGYDQRGHCPMLVDGQCSIYEHRPRTCRTYDCRIFPAAGIRLEDDTKALIDRRAGRWRFGFPTEADGNALASVRSAAGFLAAHADVLVEMTGSTSPTAVAVAAVEYHDLFLGGGEAVGAGSAVDVDPEVILGELRRRSRR